MLGSLLQAMKKLQEKSATVKVRQVDLLLAKEIIEPARKQFTALFQVWISFRGVSPLMLRRGDVIEVR